jgi:tetraprenyl-beta-curcumene synthase
MNVQGQQTGIRVGVALLRASARELIWGLRLVSREVGGWRERAAMIPDAGLRSDALRALRRKRGNINGAALFWTLPDRRNSDLLTVLVAYEILADFLDCVSERSASLGIANGRQLHLALVEALDCETPVSDYYRYHPYADDGGYLRALVESCRAHSASLSGYEAVRPLLSRAARLSSVLPINHEPDAVRREQALRAWDADHVAEHRDWVPAGSMQPAWYERTAGASAWVTVLAMLALAAERAHGARGGAETYWAYLASIAPAGAMLDSYGDIVEDEANGDHSYIAHYRSKELAVKRVEELVRGARREVGVLPSGARHVVIAGCLIAFYLSKDSVRGVEMREDTRRLRRAGGPLVWVLLPALRIWRLAYGQRSA